MTREALTATRAGRVTLVMACLFAMNGLALPFLSRWLEVERALSGTEIGVVLSLPLILRAATGPLIAFWADGCADRRTPLRALITSTVVAYGAFFFIPQDFPGLVAAGFAALTLFYAVTPLMEGALMRASQEGRLSYGRARGIGSGAFVVGNVLGGFVIARFGLDALVAWVLTSLALATVTSWRALLADPAPPAASAGARVRLAATLRLLSNRRFMIALFACGLIQAAHGFYYGFSTLVWRGQDIAPTTAGLLWAFGTIVEVAFLWTLPFFERRASPGQLILAGGLGAALRWTLMGFAPTGLWLWPIQGLHALSFAATFVGAMRLIFRETPEETQGFAQTMNSALSGGLLVGAAMLASGVLYDAVGARGYWAMAVMAGAGAGLSVLLISPPQRAPAPRS